MEYQDLAKTQPEPGAREEHREGTVARSIEQQTAKVPSDWFLWAAFGSIASSRVSFTGTPRADLIG
jgi:hypothetical protein